MVSNYKYSFNNINIIIPNNYRSKTSILSQKEMREINNLEIIKEMEVLEKTNSLIKDFKVKKRNIVLFGLGGSSLSLKTILESLNHQKELNKKTYIIDNLDGSTFNNVFDEIKIKSSLFIFVSKSGDTYEIINLLKETIKKIKKSKSKISSSLLFISENNNGYLNKFSLKENIPIIHINPNIGGRFSALSKSTLIPCEILNVKWKKIVKGANKTYQGLITDKFKVINQLVEFYYKNLQKKKTNTGLISYKDNLDCFGEWFMQLWGESLGKTKNNGIETGLTPARYIGPKDQHSQLQLILDGPKDKTLTIISTKKNSNSNSLLDNSAINEKNATIKALKNRNVPYVQLEIETLNEETLGSLFIIFHVLTIRLAKKMKVNPFNQPGVELIKSNLKKFMI